MSMDDNASAETTEQGTPGGAAADHPSAVVERSARVSPIWLVPLIAVATGVWMLVQSYLNQGPVIEISFANAEGLVAGETRVQTLAVELGTVTEVRLNDSFDGVVVVAQLVPAAAELLHTDSKFWIVRPRIGTSGISGLSTLLSGSYIELAPGTGARGARRFQGLNEIPLTPPDTPGVQVELISEVAGSLSVGSPVLYRGYRVGRIESQVLDVDAGEAHYMAFVDAPYSDLVNTATRFWNASGVSISAGVSGFDIRTESLESLFTGGVTFGVPEGANPGEPVESGSRFRLFPDYESLVRNPFRYSVDYLLLFDSSVRGLQPDAPVEYRGLQIGTVVDVAFDYDAAANYLSNEDNSAIPVLVRLEPGWLNEDTQAAADELRATLAAGVKANLRASLAVGNLLTGSLYVSLDYFPDAEPATVTERAGFNVLPTVASGLEQIEQKVASLLTKLQELPLDDTLATANEAMAAAGDALADMKGSLGELDVLLGSVNEAAVPDSLSGVLGEARTAIASLGPDSPLQQELTQALRKLQETLDGAESVLATYDRQPNAVLLPKRRQRDPVPGGSR
ncbi:MAG: intermembrane transport protein PqiB [Pseudomonadota bacterium]